ncbi:MAG: recombinase family protein [Acholeplasmatales bacterium]|nr:recombinase family protein [Acholeplasmatales bacterium]
MKTNNLAVIYARFSADDNEDNGGARSIENQIDLLSKYANKNNLNIVKIYTDIGKTGTNMNRPGLQEMFADMKKGLFNIIIVKDLSRFSRNYIEAGSYIESIFPAFNIRFISVLDNYDSSINNEDESIVLRNFLNSMYSKDIKKKIRKSLKRRVVNDDITSVVKYGFKKDKDGKLIIDEYAANIVRRIFKEAIDGKMPIDIARGLEQDKIYNPSSYKKYILKIKPNHEPNDEKKYKWDSSTIRGILNDYEYCGHAVNLVAKKIKVFDSKNISINNKRPIIIDEDTFTKAPKRFKKIKPQNNRYLKKLIYCKTCGKLMFYTENKRLTTSYYYCSNCHIKIEGNLLREVLYKDALDVIQSSIYSPKEFIKEYMKKYSKLNQRSELENNLKRVEKNIQLLFEDKFKGLLTDNQYLSKLKDLNQEYESIENGLNQLPKPINVELLQYKYYEYVKNINKEVKNEDNIIYSTINKVYVDCSEENPIVDINYIFTSN